MNTPVFFMRQVRRIRKIYNIISIDHCRAVNNCTVCSCENLTGGFGMLEEKRDNGTLTIMLPERIDATCAREVETEIDEICGKEPFDRLVLDADRLEYTSSAGLRIIIKLVKMLKNVSVINVIPEVYEIFRVSGFTNLLEVTRKNS